MRTTTASRYPTVVVDRVLDYPGLRRVSACHLRVFQALGRRPVAVLGTFGAHCGTSTANAIEAVATRAAEVLDRDDALLVEWRPGYDGIREQATIVSNLDVTRRSRARSTITTSRSRRPAAAGTPASPSPGGRRSTSTPSSC